MRRVPAALVAVFTGLALLATPSAQVRPVYDLGATGLARLLQRLQTTASVLHTGAHPDDEDSFFIARVVRGDHARAAYLSLNRGEGGQNIIGPELFDALGIIRTEELLQARRLDGADQFFTRTFDYGFSKSLEEAKAKWDERDVLGDVVRVIRMYRPLVIYSRFSGTPADGHGHHSFAGYITPIAFKAAADPSQFPEQLAEGLRPWQAKKLYRGQRFPAAASDPPSVTVQAGAFDPVIGRSYAEIASEGRSQHKSQSMGGIEVRGPMTTGLKLLTSMSPAPPAEAGVFDGLDTSLSGIAITSGLPAGTLAAELTALQAAAARALTEFNALQPSKSVSAIAAALKAVRAARAALRSAPGPEPAKADADFLLALKEGDASEALVRAAGLTLDPLADRETVVPGRALTVSARLFGPKDAAGDVTVAVTAPAGWTVAKADGEAQDDTGNPFIRRESPAFTSRVTFTVPAGAPATQPYFLERQRRTESYVWTAESRGLPFDPPLLTARYTMTIGGERVTLTGPVQFRMADQVRGELRRNVNVVPAVTVGVDSRLLIIPSGTAAASQRLVVQARNHGAEPVTATLTLKLPTGWRSTPAEAPVSLKPGEQTSAPFVVHAPAGRKPGSFAITAEALAGGAAYTNDVQVIAYPHIQTHRIYTPVTVAAQVIDLKVAKVKVGYVMGTGDDVPDALRRMGVDVTMLEKDALATGDLSAFDTIVVGIRASQARPDFIANHGRLLQYVEKGGTLVVQYQQPDYIAKKVLPFPAEMASRVTDELAPVEILQPAHPIFTFPNTITAADFSGWVQDRNLYAFTKFDPKYVPLLATADRGEPPQTGGEVVAEIGKGRFVYTAYAWFRQLPAGVPGAYRQFANLVSLSKAPRAAPTR
jgi:LmbE family N-acetylglucosaminyl deacetylase